MSRTISVAEIPTRELNVHVGHFSRELNNQPGAAVPPHVSRTISVAEIPTRKLNVHVGHFSRELNNQLG